MSQIAQKDRLCSECGRHFLSGLVHIGRSHALGMWCISCARKNAPEAVKRLEKASDARWDDILKGE